MNADLFGAITEAEREQLLTLLMRSLAGLSDRA
jgi:hypothetical protein